MEFGVLGPLVVRDDGREVAIGAAKQRALVVRLLLDAGRPVSADRLVEDLWDGDPPRSAAQTLQTYVSQVRKAIGADRIATGPAGYTLRIDHDTLDLHVFERSIAEARRADDPRRAAVVLTQALGLWRGTPLADAAGASWAVAETVRLEELRLVALESILEARLALGEDAEVVAAAEAAVADNPLRERLWAHLVTALYRQGRQAEALQAIGRLRRHLTDELGIDPSPELRELETRVLQQQPELSRHGTVLPTGVVTFMLTDLVGSTKLWEAAPDAMARAVARHEDLLRDAVAAHDGVLIKSRGEGDSTFSVFRRATDAVAAAVDAQRAVRSEDWPAGTPIEIRVAVHTGEAVERDGDYYGRAVNRAARLRAVARAGVVTLSQAAADLVVDDLPEGWRLQQLGVQELRDLERPERIFLVSPAAEIGSSEPAPDGGPVPLQRRLAVTPMLGFVGRVPERETIAVELKRVAEGSRRVVLIAGEPGIGKTNLAAEAARAARADGATVLFGRCDEDAGVPYRPWLEALGHLIEHASRDVLERVGIRRLGELARLLPSVVDRVPSVQARTLGDPDADRWSLFGAVAAVLSAACERAPLVLVLDDLQWADRPSLQLLRHVVGSDDPMRMLILATYRDSDVAVDHPLTETLSSLRRDAQAVRILLDGLSDAEVLALVESQTGHRLDDDSLALVHALCRETDGNPFFTEAMLRHLAETGAVYLDEGGRWVARREVRAAGLPESVRDVVGRRIVRLGDDCARILPVAAVVGQEFDIATLSATLGSSEDQLLDALDVAESAGLVTTVAPGRLAFAHALVSSTLYTGLTATRRARLHRRVAEAIGSVDPTRVAELARHWAEAGDQAKALHHAREAGNLAMHALAPDEAVRWYAQALDLAADEPTRGGLLVLLGRAQRNAGDAAYRSTLAEAAEVAKRLDDARLLARAALASSQGYGSVWDEWSAQRVSLLEDALAASDPADSRTRARLLGTLGVERRTLGEVERSNALTAEALAMARRLGDEALLGQVLNFRAFAIWNPDTLAERLELTAEAVDVAGRLGIPHMEHLAAHWRANALVESGDVDAAERWLRRMREIAEETRQPTLQWADRYFRGALAFLHGHVDEADRLMRESVDHGAPDPIVAAESLVTHIAWHRGTLADDVARIEASMGRRSGDFGAVSDLGHALAETGLRPDDARALMETDLPVVLRKQGLGWIGNAAHWAEVCARVGTEDQARRLYELLEPYHGQILSRGSAWFGSAAHPLGVLAAHLGRYDDADRWFAEAEATNERIRAPFFLARTRVGWARMLLERLGAGDRERAVALLDAALDLARRFGCAGVEREATELLSREDAREI